MLKLTDYLILPKLFSDQFVILSAIFAENRLKNEDKNNSTDAQHQQHFWGYLIYSMHVLGLKSVTQLQFNIISRIRVKRICTIANFFTIRIAQIGVSNPTCKFFAKIILNEYVTPYACSR